MILFYSDTHLRDVGSFPEFNCIDSNGLTRELNNMVAGFFFIADKIRSVKPKAVINCGDVYHTTEFQSAQVIHASAIAMGAVWQACQEVGAEHHLIPGNHDILNEEHMITSVSTLVGFVQVHLEPTYIDVAGFRVGLIPFSTDHGRFYARLIEAKDNCDLLVTHADFKGCQYENGFHSNAPISPEMFSKPVISGDIHAAQTMPGGLVHYVGSLVQHRFSQSDLSKVGGALVFDENTGQVTRYPNTYSKHYVKLRDFALLASFDPRAVVLQVITDKEREEVEELLHGYEFVYLKDLRKKEDFSNETQGQYAAEDPEVLLRNYLKSNKPEVITEFDSTMKSRVQGAGASNA